MDGLMLLSSMMTPDSPHKSSKVVSSPSTSRLYLERIPCIFLLVYVTPESNLLHSLHQNTVVLKGLLWLHPALEITCQLRCMIYTVEDVERHWNGSLEALV